MPTWREQLEQGGERFTGDAAGDDVIATRVAGDTVDAFTVDANGTMSWGPGSGAVDVVLSRPGANRLALASGDTFEAPILKATGDGSASAVAVALNDADSGLFLQAANTPAVAAGGTEVMRFSASSTSADVGILVQAYVGGTTVFRQVSVDAVDSGGTGYRALRIPN